MEALPVFLIGVVVGFVVCLILTVKYRDKRQQRKKVLMNMTYEMDAGNSLVIKNEAGQELFCIMVQESDFPEYIYNMITTMLLNEGITPL